MHVSDGVARLVVDRPDSLNALNPAVIFQLHQAFRRALADAEVRGIVLAGAGRAFVAGADVSFFLRNLESGGLERIVAFTKAGHQLLDDIDRSPKPVVACVHGAALGGGLELALACDQILAAPQASLGFPETGIGLYPGLGGTQRLPRRIGVGLAKWMLYTAKILSAAEASAIGLVDQVVPVEELEGVAFRFAKERCFRGAKGDSAAGAAPGPGDAERLPSQSSGASISEEHRALERFFATSRVEEFLSGRVETGGDPRLIGAVRRVRTKAPLALRFVEQFIEQGAALPLHDALPLELAHLEDLFRSADAREGLLALGKRQPVFQGR